jgi:uncharacterized protein (DUF2236 family)
MRTAAMFPPDSVIRRVSLEPALLLGAGRALLLQLASPAVAAGVHDHSEFKANPFKRLQGTLEAVNAMVFGSVELATAVGARVQRIHSYVVGPSYTANDPSHLMWVHATLLDTALLCHERLVAPLSPAEAETYYEEMARVATMFGLSRSEQPPTLAAFRAWFDDAVAAMQPTDVSRGLASFIVSPTLPLSLHVPLAPLLGVQRTFAIGTLPPVLRERLGFAWTDGDERRLGRIVQVTRAVFRATPRPMRVAPSRLNVQQLLWFAARHVNDRDRTPPQVA